MATPLPPGTHEIFLGISPNEADIAICSTSPSGGQGQLSDFVLKEYGYNKKELRSLDLMKGYDLLHREGQRPILFVVTTGGKNTASNLEKNLDQAIHAHIDALSNKEVWVPLMGTGSGGLQFEESYHIITQVFSYVQEITTANNVRFLISIPQDKRGEAFYQELEKQNIRAQRSQAQEGSTLEDHEIQSKGNFQQKENSSIETSQFEAFPELDFTMYMAKADWEDDNRADEFFTNGIWYLPEAHGDSEYVIGTVEKGDKIFLSLEDNEGIIVIGLGTVVNNPKDGQSINVHWEQSHPGLSLNSPGDIYQSYDRPIQHISPNDITIFDDIRYLPEWQETGIPVNRDRTTTLAGLLSDSDAGPDYLNIAKDVNAFARVIAAKSFTPPLAFGLFGKWGSGKSFFMRKLMEQITKLSEENPKDAFCEGIAHVHFNAWSYMDSNLWASMVSRIFEGLQQYISEDTADAAVKAEIEKTLTQSLSITQQELRELEQEQENIAAQLQALHLQKQALQKELEATQGKLRSETLERFLLQMDKEFDIASKVDIAIQQNQSFIKNKEQFRSIIPDTYWNNPVDLYERVQSHRTLLRSFFLPSKRKENFIWLLIIIMLIIGVPLLMEVLNVNIEKLNLKFPSEMWALISVVGGLYVKGMQSYNKLQPMVASFWKLKEDYNDKKQEAISSFEEQQRAYHAQIETYKTQLQRLDERIQNNQERKKDLEYRLKNTLSTEALYSFIERRSQSKDYKKHLGIVSTIRKDFEILSALFTGHNKEYESGASTKAFLDHFNKPLERIVLYIDDLDRCPENRVVEVLEAVNLLMAFPLFIVVVGVDPRWVKNALIQKHQLQFGGTEDHHGYEVISPSGYLEKIFQVPFNLKAANDESVKFMLKKLVSGEETTPVSKSVEETTKNEETLELNEEISNDPNFIPPKRQGNESLKMATPTVVVPPVSIEALQFSENETELIQSMSTVLGPNPRSIKRFTNIFRIIKAHADFPLNLSDEALLSMMFLIAFPIGEYRDLYPSFCTYLSDDALAVDVLSFLNNVPPHIDKVLEQDRWDFMNALQKEAHPVLNLPAAVLNKHISLALRFHFSG